MTLAVIERPSYTSAIFAKELAVNTRLAYQKGWASFSEWCAERGQEPLKATDEDVSAWMIGLAQGEANGSRLHPGTVQLYKSGVNKMFEVHGLASPCKSPLIKATMKVVKRDYWQPSRAVEALRDYQVQRMITLCPSSPIGYRDAAIMALGFACALRRSELIGLQVADCRFLDDETDQYARMIVTVRQSKTDQAGDGHTIPVINGNHITPITHLRRWLDSSGVAEGYLFRAMKRGGTLRESGLHTSDIPRLVKKYARMAGYDSRVVSGHSLRAGFVTSAAVHQARPDKIMAVTRHTSLDMIMKYTRDANLFDSHAGEGFL